MRTGGVEPPQPEALALQAGELANAQRPRERGGRPDSNRRRRDHDPECLPLYHGHSGDGRARTGGLSPDKRALWPSELRPRESRGWDSNPRSRAHEAREDNRSSTALRQVWLAGLEPAIPGFQGRWGGQLPHSQKTNVKPVAGIDGNAGGRPGLLPRLLPRGTGLNPLPRGRPARRCRKKHPRRDSNPQPPG